MQARRWKIGCTVVCVLAAVGCVNETGGGGLAGRSAALDEDGDEPEPRATGLDSIEVEAEDPLPGSDARDFPTEAYSGASSAATEGERNFGHTVTAGRTEQQRARSDLLRRRAERLDECLGEVYAAFADRPFAERNARANEVARSIVDGDAVAAMPPDEMPTPAEERARVRRILREAGVR